MIQTNPRYYTFIFALTILFLGSCVNLKKEMANYGDNEKSFVVRQKIKGNKAVSTYDLKLHIKQQENAYVVIKSINPQIHAYYIGKREKYLSLKPFNKTKIEKGIVKLNEKYKQDLAKDEDKLKKLSKIEEKYNKKLKKRNNKLKEGTWFSNTIGEAPYFLDTTDVEYSRKQLELYLNTKGFFDATVQTVISTKKKRSVITYILEENQPHLISEVAIEIEDQKLRNFLITDFTENSLLITGNNFDVDKITAERDRITRKMKNSGYFEFERQNIYFNVDTTIGNHNVSINLIVSNPEGKQGHTIYHVKNVIYSEDVLNATNPDSTSFKNINYIHSNNRKISPKILNRNIKIRPNSYYNFEQAQLTQQLLSNLNSFKFVNINYQKLDSNNLVAYINTSNMKKYGLTAAGGVNVNINQGQSLPGPFVSMSWMSRRFFKGYELFEISGKYSFESQPNITDASQNYKTREAGINASLTFPKLLFPFGVNDLFWRTIPKTRVSIGYNDIERVEYDRSSLNGSISYSGFWSKNSRWNFSIIDLNIVNTRRISDDFRAYLESLAAQGNNLGESFKPAIISNINFSYVFDNNDVTKNKKAEFHYFNVEIGGPLYSLVRNLNHKYGDQTANNEVLGLPFYEYFRVNYDLRKYYPVTKISSLNFRLNTGLAIPYGSQDNPTLPYEKFYFAGGLNSIRAWEPRRLGPGSYADYDENGNISYQFEQPGEILIEGNIEYRTKVIGFIHAAGFLDFGNVWMTKTDNAKEGADFKKSSIPKEIAVGVGLGLRFDFSFLIFRWDVGAKMWDPARQGTVPWNDPNKIVHNIGIGYPF